MAPKAPKSAAGKSKSTKKWEFKRINVEKTRDPQRLMEHFYPKVKTKRAEFQKNFQGFEKRYCKYAETLGEWVYCPPDYGRAQLREHERTKRWPACSKCHLYPCVTAERRQQIIRYCDSTLELSDGNKGVTEMVFDVSCLIQFMMGQLLTPQYVHSPRCVYKVPECALRLAEDYIVENAVPDRLADFYENNDQEQHPDDELAAGAEDAEKN